MKKMRRWASVLLTICMLMAVTPQPAMAGPADGPMATQTAMTAEPTGTPTNTPTSEPTGAPTSEATDAPATEPTGTPTSEPTGTPTSEATDAPTSEPTDAPTSEPTDAPTSEPTDAPATEPTDAPTSEPTDAPAPEPMATLAAAPAARAADVTLTIEVDREKAPEGDSLRYIVDLTNAGDSATEQLSVNIGVPEDKLDVVSAATYAYTASWDWDTWVWKVLPLEPGKTARLSLTANVLTVETGEAVTVTASIPDGPEDSASFTGIGEYRIEGTTTIITGSVNLDDVPTYSSLIIEATGTVTGGVSYGREVRNAGTITGGTLNGSVDNRDGTITGGTFYDNVNNESGTITGGTFYGSVDNEGGTITGGTFNGNLSNDNGGRVQGQDANVPTINGAIENESGSSILQPCNFGGNARVRSNTGTIQVTMFVNGEAKAFNYGANILESLGGGTWCLLNEDSFSVCGANDTFGLQTRSYGKLSAPSVTLDYETESITVTVPDYLAGLTAEDEVYLGFPLDILTTWEEWNDVFASSGSYTSTLSRINSINEMFTGNPLPRDAGDGDVEIPVFFGSGTVVSDAYPGAVTTLVVPERPECGRVEPLALITGVDRLGIDATLRDTYDFGIAPAGDPVPDEPTILDEDGDGLITGLKEGEEYIVFLRLKATGSSFRSAWQEQGTATTVKTYTVTYTDGVDGDEVFADQVTSDLLEGDETPAFNGTPEREGYVFAGWNPAVAAAVSGDATYTATWKVDRNGNGVADEEEPKYTVTYTDGVDGEEIFADQVTSDLLVGEATPAFSGTPERKGYVFAGWNPAVAATVSGDATYAATWEKIADERDSDDPAEIARKLAAGEAVEGLVTDRFGAAKPYEPLTMRTLDEESGEEQKRTLIIAADPVRDEDGEIVARDGEPVYEQRNLHLSQSLLNALAELNYTHIRFAVKDAALEWAIADMREDGNVIRLAPMEQDELTQAEREAIGEAELLSDAYRARITAMVDGEETDITAEIPSLTAWFDAETVRQLAEGETAQCLLAPGDGEPEKVASEAVYVEEGEEAKEISYQAALADSGLFGLALQ